MSDEQKRITELEDLLSDRNNQIAALKQQIDIARARIADFEVELEDTVAYQLKCLNQNIVPLLEMFAMYITEGMEEEEVPQMDTREL